MNLTSDVGAWESMFIRDIRNPGTLPKFSWVLKKSEMHHIRNDFSDRAKYLFRNCLPRWINKQKYYSCVDII